MSHSNYYYTYSFRWFKRVKGPGYKLECRAHPEVDIVENPWGYGHYCPKCYEIHKREMEKHNIPMYRTRPYRKFKPIRKGSQVSDS